MTDIEFDGWQEPAGTADDESLKLRVLEFALLNSTTLDLDEEIEVELLLRISQTLYSSPESSIVANGAN